MRARLLIVLTLSLLAATACGDGGDTALLEDRPTDDVVATPTAEETAEQREVDAVVAVASSDLGEILVDGDGMTLYIFVPDDQGEPTCTEGCAETWPPFQGPAAAGDGVNESLLSTTQHPSGATQTTYNGWPLYHFARDAEAGETNGQGVGDNWYVIGPDGEPVRDSSGRES